jgi:hypothetical protein
MQPNDDTMPKENEQVFLAQLRTIEEYCDEQQKTP